MLPTPPPHNKIVGICLLLYTCGHAYMYAVDDIHMWICLLCVYIHSDGTNHPQLEWSMRVICVSHLCHTRVQMQKHAWHQTTHVHECEV